MGFEKGVEADVVKPKEPDPVKLFLGILYSETAILTRALEMLQVRYGEIDYRSRSFEFDITDYYVPEMGEPIYRLFVSFEHLIHPKEIARIKVETNRVEDHLAVEVRPPGSAEWIGPIQPRHMQQNTMLSDGSFISIYNELFEGRN